MAQRQHALFDIIARFCGSGSNGNGGSISDDNCASGSNSGASLLSKLTVRSVDISTQRAAVRITAQGDGAIPPHSGDIASMEGALLCALGPAYGVLSVEIEIADGSGDNGSGDNGASGNGTYANGARDNGTRDSGASGNGTYANGASGNGARDNSAKGNGTYANGARDNGAKGNGTYANGAPKNKAKAAKKAAAAPGAGRRQARSGSRDRIRPGDFDSSMKGIAGDIDAYFEKNPGVLCGARVEGPWTPISDLSVDTTERVSVRGDLIFRERKPIKDDKSLLEFALYDGTGSIVCKLFVKNASVKHVEPKLEPGSHYAVRGAIQYDSFLREPALFAVDICARAKKPRMDAAPEKRVELHMHTRMSAHDAIASAAELVRRAAEWGHSAVAVTDHGVVQAFPEAYEAGRAHGIKVILGVEGYMAESDGDKRYDHVVLLAKNQAGLKNLYKLVSVSHLGHFYKKPRMLRGEIESCRDGLVVGSACESGELYRAAVAGAAPERLRAIAAFYDYLEIQPAQNNKYLLRTGQVSSPDGIRAINATIAALGDELGKPVVAACDVHFMDERDEVFRRILFSGQGYDDAEDQPPLFMRTTDEMLREFSYLGDAKAYEVVVTNTNLVSSWIDDGVRPIPPGTFTPKLEGASDDLTQLVERSAAEIYGDPLPPPVRERLDRELGTIVSKEFAVMYMIARRLVKKSNDDGYLVGSRGSVGSSLVATLAGITEVNPLPPHYVCPSCKRTEFPKGGAPGDKQGDKLNDSPGDKPGGSPGGSPGDKPSDSPGDKLGDKPAAGSGFDLPPKRCPSCGAPSMRRDGQDILFEIFLGAKGQEKAPDIDLNFSGDYQATAQKYMEELFGAENVFKAGTISTYAKKTAYGYVKKYIDEKGLTPGKAETERLVSGLVGVKRTTGQHPGGIVVVPQGYEIYDFTPIQRPADAVGSDIVTTHFDFDSLHDTLLKLDILGHDDPTMIRMLEDITGVPSSGVDIGDPAVLSLFTGTEALGVAPEDIGSPVGTYGIPEFGTQFVRQMLVEARPKTFADLVQISGLSHGTNVWTNNAQDLIRDGTCTVSEVIGTRESLVLYLMRMGLEPLSAFNIMESVRKGKGVSPGNEALMREKGVPEWYIASCKRIDYIFPKAHAAAYVMMACRQAWYKINMPKAFYAAYFTIRADEFKAETMARGAEALRPMLKELADKGRDASDREKKTLSVLEVIVEMHARGIRLLPIDLSRSDATTFGIEDGGIRPPFASLSGLGEAAARNICDARAQSPFATVEDLAHRGGASKTVVEALRACGALEGLPEQRQMSFF